MSKRGITRPLIVVTVMAMALAAAGAGVGAGNGADARSEHQRIVDYWTPERVANATPRDIVLDHLPNGVVPNKGKPPGTPGGGGGGTDTATKGSSWTGAGAVLQTTGKVLFKMGSSNYVCSGSVARDGVAGRSLVLTAGHCVYDDAANKFAINWMFVPEFDTSPTFTCANTEWGCWTATALVTTQAWAETDFNHDIGFAVMGTGTEGTYLDTAVGAQAIAFNQTHPDYVYAFGYPAAKKYNGSDLVYCAGDDFPDPYGSTDHGLDCNMTGGSSGGPWFIGFDEPTGTGTLNSVTSFGYRGLKDVLFGPYFGPLEKATYTVAKSESTTGNTLVGS